MWWRWWWHTAAPINNKNFGLNTAWTNLYLGGVRKSEKSQHIVIFTSSTTADQLRTINISFSEYILPSHSHTFYIIKNLSSEARNELKRVPAVIWRRKLNLTAISCAVPLPPFNTNILLALNWNHILPPINMSYVVAFRYHQFMASLAQNYIKASPTSNIATGTASLL